MSYSEFINQQYYDAKILKELEEERRNILRNLVKVEKKIADLKGYEVSKSSGIREINESTLCRSCKMISAIVYDNMCYNCCV